MFVEAITIIGAIVLGSMTTLHLINRPSPLRISAAPTKADRYEH
jgi:hypothetical protein